jgi:hypothetical protein
MIAPTARRLTTTWIALLLATGGMLLAGELWQSVDRAAPIAAILAVLTLIKGRLIALDFMELRGTARLWHGIVLGWLVVVIALTGLAWWLGR